ncbi:hypothetical protein DCC81_00290 [Chitinophaga parva]|uniref:HTH araC/xylS-type domain-containing protein n=1 Tax=Chitinophaga parva TaxID=2169414 RepID=A0A2T7BJW0_9BACT|nr:AraC family transcriptional regulator [Chitinophaga parva]PUZ27966.1 hypothetical protein DCC81_00290 [Chitinophaga parva]
MQIPARFLAPFLTYARLRQVPLPRIPEMAEYPEPLLADRFTVMPVEGFLAVLSAIVTHLPEEDLGLRVGRSMELAHIGIVYELSLRTASLQEALHYCHDYLRRSLPFALITLRERPACVEVSITMESPLLQRVLADFVVTLIARELAVLTGNAGDTAVEALHPGAYRVHFNTAGLLQKPRHYKGFYKGFETLLPAYLQLLEALQADHSFTSRVKQMALSMANPLLPDLAQTAAAFHLTPRTLQRRLRHEGGSFAAVREHLKRRMCHLLLHHDDYDLLEVSLLLGYAEPASFYHAYKKWYGRSPAKHRELEK